MQKTIKIALSLFIFSIFLTSCGPTIYLAEDFSSVSKSHKRVAILPLDVRVEMKELPDGMTKEELDESNIETGYTMQSNIYTELLRKSKDYRVKFQDVDKTNSIFAKNELSYDDIVLEDKAKICELLEVDALISGNMRMSKPMSGAGAAALGVLFGSWGSTNKVYVTMNIHEGQDSDLMWKYDYEASGSVGSNPEQLSKSLMRNVASKFPYKK